MANARNTALKILLKIENDDAYSNIALNNAIRESNLNQVDGAFVAALVYGVLERKLTLDWIIKQYSKIPLKKIEITTKMILRMGILQLLFMDKIPESAAVNESVNLAKKHKLQKSAGFINGILRSITRAEQKYKLPDEKEKEKYLSIKYSVPENLVKLWINSYGYDNAEGILKSLGGRSEIYARVNTLKTDADNLLKDLENENVNAEKSEILPDAIKLKNTGSIENLKAYKEGKFHIQDLSSQICVNVLSPKRGEIMLDVCAAPGGKTFTSAQYMHNRGKIFSCDMYDHKLNLIKSGAKRLGIECVIASKRDALSDVKLPTADKILCDVPCSGLGILSRKPEIRYKDNLITEQLPQIQYNILCKSSKFLAVGGVLVYSTCTLNPAENNENTKKFLSEHPDFEGIKINLPEKIKRSYNENDYEITLMPHTCNTDGFYIAAFKRKS